MLTCQIIAEILNEKYVIKNKTNSSTIHPHDYTYTIDPGTAYSYASTSITYHHPNPTNNIVIHFVTHNNNRIICYTAYRGQSPTQVGSIYDPQFARNVIEAFEEVFRYIKTRHPSFQYPAYTC